MLAALLAHLILVGGISSPLIPTRPPADPVLPPAPNPSVSNWPGSGGVMLCSQDFTLSVEPLVVRIGCRDATTKVLRDFKIANGDPIPRGDVIAFVQPMVTMIALARSARGESTFSAIATLRDTLRILYDAQGKIQQLGIAPLP